MVEIGLVVQCEEEEDLPTHYPIFNGYKHDEFHVYQLTEEFIHKDSFRKVILQLQLRTNFPVLYICLKIGIRSLNEI